MRKRKKNIKPVLKEDEAIRDEIIIEVIKKTQEKRNNEKHTEG